MQSIKLDKIMIKKLFLLCCFCAVVIAANAGGWIHLHVNYNNPNPIGTGKQRTPIQPPTVYIEDYTLSFSAFEEDCTIQLLEDSGVVYSDVILAGTTSYSLPGTLSGEYTIQLLLGNWIFEGEIEL